MKTRYQSARDTVVLLVAIFRVVGILCIVAGAVLAFLGQILTGVVLIIVFSLNLAFYSVLKDLSLAIFDISDTLFRLSDNSVLPSGNIQNINSCNASQTDSVHESGGDALTQSSEHAKQKMASYRTLSSMRAVIAYMQSKGIQAHQTSNLWEGDICFTWRSVEYRLNYSEVIVWLEENSI